MKSERKQTLETNLLADRIEELAIQLKKALPVIIVVTVITVAGFFAYGLYSSAKETESAKAWTALYFSDTDSAELTAISSDFSGTAAGLWAKQTAADANMARALDKVYIDRDLAEKFYKEAIEDYQAVSEKSSDSFLVGRAHYGLAQAYEGMGDTAQALSNYRKVMTNKSMGSDLVSEVTKRTAWLESKAGDEFYAWYKTSRASAPVLNTTPATNAPVPSSPDITFPAKPGETTPPPGAASSNPTQDLTPSTDVPIKPDESKVELKKSSDIPAATDK